MPSDWIVYIKTDGYLGDQGQVDGAYIIFVYLPSEHVIRAEQDIFRYQDRSAAAWNYERFERTQLDDGLISLSSPWEVPPGFDFSSEAADQWRFACASSTFHPQLEPATTHGQCNFLAQYSEYLVFFNIVTRVEGQEIITPAQLNDTVKKIDEKMRAVHSP
jgi:hypothetical protein